MKRFFLSWRHFFSGFFIVFTAIPVTPHTTRGHNVLEAVAYKNLLAKGKGEIPHFPTYTGKEILDYLIANQILRVPSCYPINGRLESNCAKTDPDSLSWLPVIGSGDVDAVFYRQFSRNGQYFHWMASPGAVYRNSKIDPKTGAPRGLTEEAYPRAIRFITGMYYDVLRRDPEARRNYRDIYSLIHAIGDSYSDAHVERDTTTWEVKYLKPWQATAWQPDVIYWSGWKVFFTEKIHWFPEDARDLHYLRTDLVSESEIEFFEKNPYLVPPHYLNKRGIEAAQAIEDLLLVVFAVLVQESSDPQQNAEVARKEWVSYLNKHFTCSLDTTTIASITITHPPKNEQEWRPMTQIGLRGITGTVPGSKAYTLVMNFAKPPSWIDPFGFAAGYELGRRTTKGKTVWVGSISFGLYLWQYSEIFALGLNPTIADMTYDGTHLTIDPMLSFLRFDYWIQRRIWLSAEGLRYSLLHGSRSPEFSLTVGVAFSKDVPFHWSSLIHNPEKRLGNGVLANEVWKIPDPQSPLRVNPKYYGIFHPFGYGFNKRPRHVTILPIGYTFLNEIDKTSRRSKWSYGLYVGLGGEHFEENVWIDFRVAPVLRYKLMRILAFQVEPLRPLYRIGLSKYAQGTYDAESAIGMVIMLGSFDVNIELLRYSLKGKEFDQKAIAGLRFGILRE